MNFRFDTISFFIGMAVATAVWWVITLARPILEQVLQANRNIQKERALRASSALEDAHRKIVYKQTQGMHLAATLFALDEIAEEPKLLAPPVVVEPQGTAQHRDIVDQAIPYIPNYPELGAFYHSRTLTISEAISGGMHLVITGQPGAGKTTALAHLASQIANRAPSVSLLHDFVPFFIHVADLGLPLNNPKKPEDYLAPIVEKLSVSANMFDTPRIPGFVTYAFTSGRALFLLDGVDELPQSAIQDVSAYLRVLLRQYPKIRIITTGATEYIDGILSLGFTPLAIMPWNSKQQANFLARWTTLWEKFVAHETWAHTTDEPLNPTLLNRWLSTDNFGLTPLEYTLKIWGAYAGDARGSRPVDAIEAHIRRLTPTNTPMEALNTLGVQASLGGTSIFDSRQAREWTRSYEPAEAIDTTLISPAPIEDPSTVQISDSSGETKKEPKKAAQTTSSSLISNLTNLGLLVNHKGSQLRFNSLVFLGFLAGKGLANQTTPDSLLNQPSWAGQTITLRYIAAFGDATSVVNHLLSLEDNVLMRPKIIAGRLLKDAPRDTIWRSTVMATLIQTLQGADNPLGVRGQAMAAFALSGDPNASALFRQLMRAPSNELRQLAALGAGLTHDSKAVDGLINLLTASNDADARPAACLALVEIGTSQALEAVATSLMRGDEEIRTNAAEALANHPGEGHEALKEGITSQDILVRRAIVYGLARVNDTWAIELLEKVQLDDEQWVVRNVAVELLTSRLHPDPHIPHKLTPPAETPWLIEFAGKHGMGVIPGQPATNVFLLALKDPSREYANAALNYLRYSPSAGVLSALYPHLYGTDPQLKESVYQVLAEMAYGGTPLPNPMQFGLG
jgi:hypothetical protein